MKLSKVVLTVLQMQILDFKIEDSPAFPPLLITVVNQLFSNSLTFYLVLHADESYYNHHNFSPF